MIERLGMRTHAVILGLSYCLLACDPAPSPSAKCAAGSCIEDAGACGANATCSAGPDASTGEKLARTGAGSGSRTQPSTREDAGLGDDANAASARGAQTAGPDGGADNAASAGDDAAAGEAPKSARSGAGTPSGNGGAGAEGKAEDDMRNNADSMSMAEAGAGGAPACEGDACKAEQRAQCEAKCDTCAACDAEAKACQPVTGRDDADSCSDTRTCSSQGECLYISESQPQLGPSIDYVELTTSYAQVIDFADAARVEEIRLEVSCNENDQAFPPVWISLVEDGVPSETAHAFANVVYQPPTDDNAFALLELSKKLDEPALGPIAIVVGASDMSCIARVNRDRPYERGSLLMQRESGLWQPVEGSLVFQVLSSAE